MDSEIYISDMIREITEDLLLSPGAEDKLKIILHSWDGKKVVDDM